MIRIADETNVALAVSLHAPNDALRSELVPINRKHPIKELLALLALRRERTPQHHVRIRDARRRQRRRARARTRAAAAGHPAKVNLIPFNPFPGTTFRRSEEAIERFRDLLIKEA